MYYLGDRDLFVLNKACQKYGPLDYRASPVRGFQNNKFFCIHQNKIGNLLHMKNSVLLKPVFIQPIFRCLCI